MDPVTDPELEGLDGLEHLDGPVAPAPMTGDTDSAASVELDDEYDDEDETGRLIRPYAITGGRTGTDGPEIDLESQVLATPRGTVHAADHRWEARRVIDLCGTPMALVEIAARLEVPVGVARVLVADLVADGSVSVHVPPPISKNYTSLLEQVLDGVRAL